MAEDDVTLRIAVAWRELRRVKSMPLSVPVPTGQLDTMFTLSRLGPCTMADLSAALRVDASTATRAVDRLVAGGIAVRRRAAEDARTVLVSLTATGRALVRKLTAERLEQLERTLALLSPAERRQIAESLELLVKANDAVAGHAPAATS